MMCVQSSVPTVGTKAERFVEPRGPRILGPQAEAAEVSARGFDDLRDQPPAHPEPPLPRQDVQLAHPADPRLGGERIDVEPAHADHPLADPGDEQRLAGLVEPIRAAGPLLGEPSDETQSVPLALRDQFGHPLDRRPLQSLDAHGHGGLRLLPEVLVVGHG
jgi:hypothetical protein